LERQPAGGFGDGCFLPRAAVFADLEFLKCGKLLWTTARLRQIVQDDPGVSGKNFIATPFMQ
jgi:hypothetical protein